MDSVGGGTVGGSVRPSGMAANVIIRRSYIKVGRRKFTQHIVNMAGYSIMNIHIYQICLFSRLLVITITVMWFAYVIDNLYRDIQ